MSTAVLTSVTAGTSLIMTVIGRPAYNVHAAIARWSHGTICGTNLRPNLVSWFEEKSLERCCMGSLDWKQEERI